mmetsp:Transcript_33306/g.106966  ORF Transcript_33306/g.106966 Transcript_33306/m.106966 type:complete len:211 (-) Transcript_33306:366-998(-)
MQCTCSRQIVAARTCCVPAASAAGKGSGFKPHARRKRSTRTEGEPAHEATRKGALCPPPIPAAAAVPSAHEVERAALADQPVHARRLAVGVEGRLCAAVRLDHELCEGLRRGWRRRGRRQVEPRGVAVERLGAQLVFAGLRLRQEGDEPRDGAWQQRAARAGQPRPSTKLGAIHLHPLLQRAARAALAHLASVPQSGHVRRAVQEGAGCG